MYQVLSGILESFDSDNASELADHHFATALQLAGIASLGFVQTYKNNEVSFLEGFPYFPHHSNQYKLSRVRRLISGALVQGKLAACRQYLENEGIDLRRK